MTLWAKASRQEQILTIALSETARVHPRAINRYMAIRYPHGWGLHTGRLGP